MSLLSSCLSISDISTTLPSRPMQQESADIQKYCALARWFNFVILSDTVLPYLNSCEPLVWNNTIHFGNDTRIWPGICSGTTHTNIFISHGLFLSVSQQLFVSLTMTKERQKCQRALQERFYATSMASEPLLPPCVTS